MYRSDVLLHHWKQDVAEEELTQLSFLSFFIRTGAEVSLYSVLLSYLFWL